MWDPDAYLRFADERTRPARDLLAAVDLDAARRVVDLGCGTGTSTRLLAARWPDADILGLDSSAEMVDAARAEPGGDPANARIRYEVADIASWQPATPPDVVFTNAALHWIAGHLDLLGPWLAGLAPGGRLALQVPGNVDAPSHALLRELCGSPRWRGRLAAFADRRESACSPRQYLDRLSAVTSRLDIWETTYLHRLAGADPVLRWVGGTALRPVLAALGTDEEARAALLAEYGAALRDAYPPGPDGITVLPFRRVFAIAGRAGG